MSYNPFNFDRGQLLKQRMKGTEPERITDPLSKLLPDKIMTGYIPDFTPQEIPSKRLEDSLAQVEHLLNAPPLSLAKHVDEPRRLYLSALREVETQRGNLLSQVTDDLLLSSDPRKGDDVEDLLRGINQYALAHNLTDRQVEILKNEVYKTDLLNFLRKDKEIPEALARDALIDVGPPPTPPPDGDRTPPITPPSTPPRFAGGQPEEIGGGGAASGAGGADNPARLQPDPNRFQITEDERTTFETGRHLFQRLDVELRNKKKARGVTTQSVKTEIRIIARDNSTRFLEGRTSTSIQVLKRFLVENSQGVLGKEISMKEKRAMLVMIKAMQFYEVKKLDPKYNILLRGKGKGNVKKLPKAVMAPEGGAVDPDATERAREQLVQAGQQRRMPIPR